MKKAVLWDYGGVISSSPFEQFSKYEAAHGLPADLIRSVPETPRICAIDPATLKQAREKLEKHIKNTYLKKVQAPLGVAPVLRAWMELN